MKILCYFLTHAQGDRRDDSSAAVAAPWPFRKAPQRPTGLSNYFSLHWALARATMALLLVMFFANSATAPTILAFSPENMHSGKLKEQRQGQMALPFLLSIFQFVIIVFL